MHVEMIEEYIKPDDGCGDYQWYDNHGILTRCKDCKFWTHIKRTNRYWCKTDDGLYDLNPSPDDFCSRAVRRTNNGR